MARRRWLGCPPALTLTLAVCGRIGHGREGHGGNVGACAGKRKPRAAGMRGHVHAGLPSVQSSGGLMPGNGNYSPNESQEEAPPEWG